MNCKNRGQRSTSLYVETQVEIHLADEQAGMVQQHLTFRGSASVGRLPPHFRPRRI